MKTLLLTGSTGAVGQVVVPVLKKRGYKIVYLARGKGGLNVRERVRALLGNCLTPEDICVEGDIIGTIPMDRLVWRGKIDAVLHCAGSISFEGSKADETWKVNAEGTENLLRLAAELEIPNFHFVSSVYVAGGAERLTETDIIGGKNNNPYEESKLAAEHMVRDWKCGRSCIHRMSIMVGNSLDFTTPSYNGYYGFFQGFARLRQDLKERFAKKGSEMQNEGIYFDDERLTLPLRIKCSPSSTLNLIPCDWFAETLVSLLALGNATDGKAYHLVHPNPPRVQWIILTTLREMGIDGVTCGETIDKNADPPPSSLLGVLQRRLNRGLEQFQPYIEHEAVFDCSQLVRDLGERYTSPPLISEKLIAGLIEYAMKANFGREI